MIKFKNCKTVIVNTLTMRITYEKVESIKIIEGKQLLKEGFVYANYNYVYYRLNFEDGGEATFNTMFTQIEVL